VLKGYLRGRASLRRAFLLIDSRHGIKPVDTEIMSLLDVAAVSYQVVLTKADKPKKGEVEKRLAEIDATLRKRPAAFPEVLVTSSEEGHGVPELRAAVAKLLLEG